MKGHCFSIFEVVTFLINYLFSCFKCLSLNITNKNTSHLFEDYYYFLNPQMLWFLQRSLFIQTLIYLLQSKSLLWMGDSYHQYGDVAVNQINQGLFTLSMIWWETRETRHKAKTMEAIKISVVTRD